MTSCSTTGGSEPLWLSPLTLDNLTQQDIETLSFHKLSFGSIASRPGVLAAVGV